MREKSALFFGTFEFIKRLILLFRRPIFLVLSCLGFSVIFISSYFFFKFEFGSNQNLNTYFDAVYWSFTTLTTVGYGDIHPVTTYGKVISILLMMIGSVLFWSYTALFAGVLLENEIKHLEREIKEKQSKSIR